MEKRKMVRPRISTVLFGYGNGSIVPDGMVMHQLLTIRADGRVWYSPQLKNGSFFERKAGKRMQRKIAAQDVEEIMQLAEKAAVIEKRFGVDGGGEWEAEYAFDDGTVTYQSSGLCDEDMTALGEKIKSAVGIDELVVFGDENHW